MRFDRTCKGSVQRFTRIVSYTGALDRHICTMTCSQGKAKVAAKTAVLARYRHVAASEG